MRIGIVAGEQSGDYLGAGLLRALHKKVPNLRAVGIAGSKMQDLGAETLFPIAQSSLIGFDGVVKNVLGLLRVRRELYRSFIKDPPDLFIGIDSPDFNLGLEEKLRRRGIRTIHYVSPTVWAWRSYRIKRIRRAVDHMLVLFPFEEEYLRARGVPTTFVGHPVADDLPLQTSNEVRLKLKLPLDPIVVAILPGSRPDEVTRLGPVFLRAAALLHLQIPEIQFVIPYSGNEVRSIFQQQLKSVGATIDLHELNGQSREAMAASNVVLVASGTAALEAALLRKPMVVAYKVSNLSYRLARLLAHTKYVSMPNNLVSRPLVPELIQDQATGENICQEIMKLLSATNENQRMILDLQGIYNQLKNNANQVAAKRIVELHKSWCGS